MTHPPVPPIMLDWEMRDRRTAGTLGGSERWVATAGLAVAIALALAVLLAPARAPAATGPRPARFMVGAAVQSYTPPLAGQLLSDPAECLPTADALFTGARTFAFEEPYVDQQGDGHYDLGDPFVDCNQNGRWDGNTLGGGSNAPRYYDHVADDVGARAMVVSNDTHTIAVEVVDNEGLFNVYADRIRAQVAADGYHLDDIEISSTHDESAPDTIGLGGPDGVLSGTDAYFVDYLVTKSALAIEQAYDNMRPATIRYAQAQEPDNLRQCWSQPPFVDDPLMPILQAVGSDGQVIATLASISQHVESLGFNPDPVQALWVSSDWVHFFRASLEQQYGGVGIEMAGAVGAVETPMLYNAPISRTPRDCLGGRRVG